MISRLPTAFNLESGHPGGGTTRRDLAQQLGQVQSRCGLSILIGEQGLRLLTAPERYVHSIESEQLIQSDRELMAVRDP
jgi:hypothetical protein